MSDAPEYSDAEEQQLSRQLGLLNESIARGQFNGRPASLEFVCELHREIFLGVRSHAGLHRAPGRLSEFVCFGPHRSADRRYVERLCLDELRRVERRAREIEGASASRQRVLASVELSVEAHAQIIFVHPFEDGNGRTARAFCDCLLVRFGLRPIPMEHTKATYIERLNAYFATGMREIVPLRDLYLSAAAPAGLTLTAG